MQAGQLLIRYLDQGLGRVEQATGEVGTVDTPWPSSAGRSATP
jgi:hypothetical protein